MSAKKKLEVLALVLARSGSKSIPRKNEQLFAGYPLMAFSIAAGLQAKSVTRTLVSTDDESMAKMAIDLGAEAPFLRPAELAQDASPDLPVFQHALKWLAHDQGYKPDLVVQLRPTSPLRPPGLVDNAVQTLLDNPSADSVRGVVPVGQNPYKMWTRNVSGALEPILKIKGVSETYNAPRQKLPQIFWQTGHVDAIRSATILKKNSMSGEVIWPIFIDSRYTVDIDTPNDWRRAEWLAVSGELDLVWPGKAPRPFPKEVKLLITDFDGVMTDNRVWTDEVGKESVAANRSDGLGIEMLVKSGVEVFVISREQNLVVAQRCKKLGIGYKLGVESKGSALQQLLTESKVPTEQTVFLGNDTNDLPCFPLVAWAAVVADSHPDVLRQADFRLGKKGGHGAFRELCDLILVNKSQRKNE